MLIVMCLIGTEYIERRIALGNSNDAAPQPQPQPQNRMLLISKDSDGFWEKIGRTLYFHDANAVDVSSDQFASAKNLAYYVADLAPKTFDELIVTSTGSGGVFYPNGGSGLKVRITDFLDKLLSIQQENGHQIAKRITFVGFDAFSNLSPDQTAYYRKMSAALNAEIAGPTNMVMNVFFSAGRYAEFMPDERIRRDPLDMPYDPITRIFEFIGSNQGVTTVGTPDYSEWFDHAQQQATASQPVMPVSTAPLSAPTAPAMPQTAVVTADRVNLRSCADITCDVIAKMDKGTRVTLDGDVVNSDWQGVEMTLDNGRPQRGFASTRYLAPAS
ncbi:MAG: SH3 domain-containing protein [Alphaproteobacteria bacterium]|nr:SH3 domain-containing protein [Alphaproteobacteria bacterium]